MKILLATDAYFPMINGVVSSTQTLAMELKELGHDVRILALSTTKEDRFEDGIYYLKSIKVGIYPEARIKYLSSRRICSIIEEWGPEIIHTQTEFSTMYVARKLVNKLKIPHIHTYHTMYEDYGHFFIHNKTLNKMFVGQLSKQLLNRMDAVVTPTDKTRDALLYYGVKTAMYTIPTGINLRKFTDDFDEEVVSEIKRKYNPQNKKVLLYLGRVSKEKNIEELLEYVDKLRDLFENKLFLISGGGPHLDALKAAAKERGLSGIVEFTGAVEPSKVQNFYRLGDIFVTSSMSETQGLTYIEAMACGLPVVCRFDKCIELLVKSGQTGFTYSNIESFKFAVQEILSDKELYSRCSTEAVKTAEKYSSKSFGIEVEKVYSKSMKEFKKRRS